MLFFTCSDTMFTTHIGHWKHAFILYFLISWSYTLYSYTYPQYCINAFFSILIFYLRLKCSGISQCDLYNKLIVLSDPYSALLPLRLFSCKLSYANSTFRELITIISYFRTVKKKNYQQTNKELKKLLIIDLLYLPDLKNS